MNKKTPHAIFLGVSSLITLVIVVIFASFASLVMISASNESKMTQKTIASAQEYYTADALAEEKLAHIVETLGKKEPSFLKDEDVDYSTSGNYVTVSFQVDINAKKELLVEAKIKTGMNPKIIERTKWQNVIKDEE